LPTSEGKMRLTQGIAYEPLVELECMLHQVLTKLS
jgi:hypothetical protein